jgi:hypothetical protein
MRRELGDGQGTRGRGNSGTEGTRGRNSGTDRKFTSKYGVRSAPFSKLPVRPQFPPVPDLKASVVEEVRIAPD